MTRSFIVIGRSATASPAFSLVDIAGTSGRLDVLLRCLRAGLLVSHGLRRDTTVYLVLLGGDDAPRVVRVDGRHVRFVRPDERALALLVQKALARATFHDAEEGQFVEIRAGLSVARGGTAAVIADLSARGVLGSDDELHPLARAYLLEEGARDVRQLEGLPRDWVVFVGDHRGFDEDTRTRLITLGATPIGVGPISVHADDAITILGNEVDRRLVAVQDSGVG